MSELFNENNRDENPNTNEKSNEDFGWVPFETSDAKENEGQQDQSKPPVDNTPFAQSHPWQLDPSFEQSNAGAPDSSQEMPTPAENGEVTYHYGVNAPKSVPANDSAVESAPPVAPPQSFQPPVQNGWQGQAPQQQYGGYGNNYNDWQRWQQPNYGQQTPPPQKPPQKKGPMAVIVALSVLCAVSIISVGVMFALTLSNEPATENPSSSVSSNENAPKLEIIPENEDAQALATPSIVDMNLDSTVVINSYTKRSSNGSYYPGASAGVETLVSTASGIIWKADGYIITNRHVVINEETDVAYSRIDVVLYDGTVYKNVNVIGSDSFTDLAVLKIDNVSNLSEAEFGKSSELKLGDKIVAMGNAGGLEWTVTQGIVSGLARDVYTDSTFAVKCLQIDAAINPGNSGGPLLNSYGKVVGINSAKIVANGYEGLGFSIPIEDAVPILNDLAQYGYVRNRVMLGISGEFVYSPFESFQILKINDDSCLKDTAAKVGDFITEINGVAIDKYEVIREELDKCSVGDKITLRLVRFDRQGQTSSLTVECTLTEVKG